MKDKKALLILIPFLLFVIIIGAFAIVGDRIPDNPPETVGNTAGNLILLYRNLSTQQFRYS